MKLAERVVYWIYCYGFWVGINLVSAPILKDLIFKTSREQNIVSIGTIGVLIQIIGIALIIGWAKAERRLEEETRGRK